MLNTDGEGIGVNDAYQLTATGTTRTGIGFAVPIATAMAAAHQILSHT
jgi:S1-C subfamily serine protease